MQFIDNVNERLGDDLRSELHEGAKLRVAAATFSIFAFEALRKELETIDELRFIFTEPAFVAARASGTLPRQQREFFIPRPRRSESTLYGSEFEIRLRNQLTQRAIARECANWIRKKAEFRSNATGAPMQQLAAVDDQVAYQPIQGFTSADLGYERSDAVSNVVTKVDDAPMAGQFVALFDQIWHNPDQLQDVTEAVCTHIQSGYAENSPERIYFLILVNIFTEFLDDLSEDVLPNDRTGYLQTGIWQALYNFQRDAALGIINKLETHSGCILADSVGLGKTFTALAVIKYYELRNRSVLVLAPKRLADNWTNYNANLTTNPFAADRFNYDVLAHTDLSRDSGESMGIPLDRVNWGNYDLVVIDESHNFRNANHAEGRETRYERLMERVMREGVATKVLMLSATPVNNHFKDLRNQLALAYEGASSDLAERVGLSTSVEEVFRRAQAAFNHWSKLPVEDRTPEAILAALDFDFFRLLDAVTIARSRKHIQTFYDTSDLGSFPDRRPPVSLRPPLTDLPDVPGYRELYALLSSLTLAVYTPIEYVFPSRLGKYEDRFGNAGAGRNAQGGAASNVSLLGRQQGIRQLMTTNLLKRLESSVEAFRLTLGRITELVSGTLDALDAGGSAVADLSGMFDDVDPDDDDFDGTSGGTTGAKVTVDLADLDVESFRRDLDADAQILQTLVDAVAPITPEHDTKLRALRELIEDKATALLNDGNTKVLVFTASTDTAVYLYRNLHGDLADAGRHVGLVTGGQSAPRTTLGKGFSYQQVLTLFAPVAKLRDKVMPDEHRTIDVLIATDCVSEGQNLQDCDEVVNYDIHWNPVRIIQRFGRVDRIGSPNECIQLVNFWPDIDLDAYLELKDRVESRMVAADLAGTGDDNVLTTDSGDVAYRREQLRRLQDEVVELEDVRTGVSITDLGLNEFRTDLLAYLRDHRDLAAAPKGMHAVVPAQPEVGLIPGLIFVLRNTAADERINRGNQLHPYYLVYLDNDGNVVADHTQVKKVLDLMRLACRGRHDPVSDLCAAFNAATDDGSDMTRCSDLLNAAVASMVQVTDDRDLDSLFTPGATTALTQSIAGLDDFELIAFLAVLDLKEAPAQ